MHIIASITVLQITYHAPKHELSFTSRSAYIIHTVPQVKMHKLIFGA